MSKSGEKRGKKRKSSSQGDASFGSSSFPQFSDPSAANSSTQANQASSGVFILIPLPQSIQDLIPSASDLKDMTQEAAFEKVKKIYLKISNPATSKVSTTASVATTTYTQTPDSISKEDKKPRSGSTMNKFEKDKDIKLLLDGTTIAYIFTILHKAKKSKGGDSDLLSPFCSKYLVQGYLQESIEMIKTHCGETHWDFLASILIHYATKKIIDHNGRKEVFEVGKIKSAIQECKGIRGFLAVNASLDMVKKLQTDKCTDQVIYEHLLSLALMLKDEKSAIWQAISVNDAKKQARHQIAEALLEFPLADLIIKRLGKAASETSPNFTEIFLYRIQEKNPLLFDDLSKYVALRDVASKLSAAKVAGSTSQLIIDEAFPERVDQSSSLFPELVRGFDMNHNMSDTFCYSSTQILPQNYGYDPAPAASNSGALDPREADREAERKELEKYLETLHANIFLPEFDNTLNMTGSSSTPSAGQLPRDATYLFASSSFPSSDLQRAPDQLNIFGPGDLSDLDLGGFNPDAFWVDTSQLPQPNISSAPNHTDRAQSSSSHTHEGEPPTSIAPIGSENAKRQPHKLSWTRN